MPEVQPEVYERFNDSAQFAADEIFNPRPTTLVMLATLEVIVKDDFGTYLLVISPRYEEVEVVDKSLTAPLTESAHWTVPYISRTLDSPSGGYKRINPALAEMDKQLAAWEPESKLKVYADTVFRGVTGIELGGSFYELKQSWSQPQVTKLYRVLRYRADLGNCEANTLADAESRKGISFLPIDKRYERVTRRRYCRLHQRTERLYRSKPVETNLCALIEDPEQCRDLKSRAIKLGQNVFFREYVGFLFCGDIAGYGAASAYTEGHMTDFSKQDQGAVLRDSAAVAFTDLFLEAGVSQVHTAGDGFICAMPLAAGEDMITRDAVQEALGQFADAYATYIESLNLLSQGIERHASLNAPNGGAIPSLGSRLAIHFGRYRFGKMSQAASLLTGFDGREIVTVSRLEQGLRTVRKTQKLAKQHGISNVPHVAVASKEAMRQVGGARKLPASFAYLGSFKAASKEFSNSAALLSVIQS